MMEINYNKSTNSSYHSPNYIYLINNVKKKKIRASRVGKGGESREFKGVCRGWFFMLFLHIFMFLTIKQPTYINIKAHGHLPKLPKYTYVIYKTMEMITRTRVTFLMKNVSLDQSLESLKLPWSLMDVEEEKREKRDWGWMVVLGGWMCCVF